MYRTAFYFPVVIANCILGYSVSSFSTTISRSRGGARIGLYRILPSPILYGVYHKKDGRWGGVYCAMVMQ